MGGLQFDTHQKRVTQRNQNELVQASSTSAMTASMSRREDVMDFKARPSQLSHHHPENDYRGFVNVCIILLVVGNVRIIIQNFNKYGILVDASVALTPAGWPMLFIILELNLHFVFAYGAPFLVLLELNLHCVFACGTLFLVLLKLDVRSVLTYGLPLSASSSS